MERAEGEYEQNIEILRWGSKLFIKGAYGTMELLAVDGYPDLLAIADQPGYGQLFILSEEVDGLYAAITDYDMQQPPLVLKQLSKPCSP